MKKTLILSIATVALGVQMANTVTTKADDVETETSQTSVEEIKNEADQLNQAANDEETSEPAAVNEEDSQVVEESESEQTTDNQEKDQALEEPAVEQSQDGTTTDKDTPEDDAEVENDGISVKTIKPKTPNMDNSVNPADEGPLLIPYKVYSNEIVYVLDPETNQPIEDADDHSKTGYKTNGLDVVYGDEASEIDAISGDFTNEVYSNGGEWGWQEATPKNLKIRALVREAEYFMEFRNHGYSNLAELNDYMTKYRELYNQFIAENDDGTPIVPVDDTKTTNHESDHTSTPVTPVDESKTANHGSKTVIEGNNSETIDLTITTIRQATLYTENGDVVGNRALVKDSTWRVDKVAMINGQKMYRVTPTEWVSAKDVK